MPGHVNTLGRGMSGSPLEEGRLTNLGTSSAKVVPHGPWGARSTACSVEPESISKAINPESRSVASQGFQ
eukprot:13084748-Alexandrium_andersonii.AAC.1